MSDHEEAFWPSGQTISSKASHKTGLRFASGEFRSINVWSLKILAKLPIKPAKGRPVKMQAAWMYNVEHDEIQTRPSLTTAVKYQNGSHAGQ